MSRSKAAEAVWRWRDPQGPTRRPWRSLVAGLLIGAVAAAVFAWFGHRIAAMVVISIGLSLFTVGLVAPPLHQRIQSWFVALGRLLGAVMAWLTLVPLFVFFFVPFARLLRTRDRGPLKREASAQVASYWSKRERSASTPESFERPF